MNRYSDVETEDAWYKLRTIVKDLSTRRQQLLCQLTMGTVFFANMLLVLLFLFIVFVMEREKELTPMDILLGCDIIILSILIYLVLDAGVDANELYAKSVGDLVLLLYDQSYTIRRLEAELDEIEKEMVELLRSAPL